jgi:hypothetical protein
VTDLGKLNWKKVITADGIMIGESDGGNVDTRNWQLTHIHVGLNDRSVSEFGLAKPFMGRVLICLPVDYVETVNDSIQLKKTFDEMKETKECQEFQIR